MQVGSAADLFEQPSHTFVGHFIGSPGMNFLAGKVDFEAALKNAVANGEDPLSTQLAKARSLEPTRVNGSNVNIDEETLAGQQTVLSTQLTAAAMTNKFTILRTSIGGQ